jgi:hypothetical protein
MWLNPQYLSGEYVSHQKRFKRQYISRYVLEKSHLIRITCFQRDLLSTSTFSAFVSPLPLFWSEHYYPQIRVMPSSSIVASIPAEVLRHIFAYLVSPNRSYEGKTTCMSVCRVWRVCKLLASERKKLTSHILECSRACAVLGHQLAPRTPTKIGTDVERCSSRGA